MLQFKEMSRKTLNVVKHETKLLLFYLLSDLFSLTNNIRRQKINKVLIILRLIGVAGEINY